MFTSTFKPQPTTTQPIRDFAKRHKDLIKSYFYLSFLAGFALQGNQIDMMRTEYQNQAKVRKDRLKEEMYHLRNGTSFAQTESANPAAETESANPVAETRMELQMEKVRDRLAWKRGLLESKWAVEEAQETRVTPTQGNVTYKKANIFY